MASIFPGSSARENVAVPLPDLGPTDLYGPMAAGEAALVVVRAPIARFLVLEPAARKGVDPEAIHDMRVSGRRIRTAIRVFRGVIPEWAENLRTELRWMGSVLGDVRDLDVQRSRLWESGEDIEAADRAVLHALDDAFVARREPAHAALIESLDSTRFERLRTELVGFAREPGLSSAEAQRPIAELAPTLVTPRYRSMRRAGSSLGADSSPAKLHAFRIRCKRVRYVIEFVAPLYGEPAESLTRRLIRLQDLLGDLHDAELGELRLRELAKNPDTELPPNAPFVLGRLSERSARRARKLRRRFPKAFIATRGRRWKDMKRAMAEPAG